ncbi:MAG: hypothetical protein S0880_29960 [Actinomycetota bacterium]|nr:hypothetical protein [Actinomycetota bacterium]
MATESKSPAQIVTELRGMLVDYAKQQTVDPVKALGRYLAYGIAGSLVLAIASVLLVLAVLRVLQTETGTALTGNWSWVPYLATLAIVAAVIGVLGMVINRTRKANMPGAGTQEP